MPSKAGGIGRWREVGDFSDLGFVGEGVFIICSYHICEASATTPDMHFSVTTRVNLKKKATAGKQWPSLAVLMCCKNASTL